MVATRDLIGLTQSHVNTEGWKIIFTDHNILISVKAYYMIIFM